MVFRENPLRNIDLILAANSLRGTVDPCNDQIWHLSCAEGEPSAFSISTSYGLRAYGMRIFPRFHLKNDIVTNPDAFSMYPSIKFQAPEFVELEFKPFPFIDVNLQIWVPTSQVVVGQATITLSSSQPELLLVEWVVMLEPFEGGKHMTPAVHGVNTILAGKSRNLEPVFLLTGMPRTNSSAYPSLGLEIALRPDIPRKITWVLSSLENEDLSFFSARRYAASDLDNEQEKLAMNRAQKELLITGGNERGIDKLFSANQSRLVQLLLPPFGKFTNHSIIQSRIEDHGFSHSRDGTDSGPDWGIQNPIDAFIASRILLPSQPEILKGFIQNFLDQQSDKGTLDMNCCWNGKRSGLNATPLLISLAAEVFTYTQDEGWLNRVIPQLVLGIKSWLIKDGSNVTPDFPSWQHILQTGLLPNPTDNINETIIQETLLRTANSPALTAFLFREFKYLQVLTANRVRPELSSWLEENTNRLFDQVQSCWNGKEGYFQYQDRKNHSHLNSKKTLTYKKNGTFKCKRFTCFTRSSSVTLQLTELFHREINIRLGSADKTLTITEKLFVFHGNIGIGVVDIAAGEIEEISIKGLRKNEVVTISEPPLDHFDPTCLVPFWAGIANEEQTNIFLEQRLSLIRDLVESDQYSSIYKIILLEFLMSQGKKAETIQMLESFYNIFREPMDSQMGKLRSRTLQLDDLIPIKLLLSLYGIEQWTPNEIVLEIDDAPLPPITVQYGKTTIEFLQGQRKVTHANGETVILKQPGKVKIMTA